MLKPSIVTTVCVSKIDCIILCFLMPFKIQFRIPIVSFQHLLLFLYYNSVSLFNHFLNDVFVFDYCNKYMLAVAFVINLTSVFPFFFFVAFFQSNHSISIRRCMNFFLYKLNILENIYFK